MTGKNHNTTHQQPAMVGLKSAASLSSKAAALLVVFIALTVKTEVSKAQSSACSISLGNLNRCGPFVVAGDPDTLPSGDCCGALATVSHDRICTALSIASRLLSLCNLPPLNCPSLPNLI